MLPPPFLAQIQVNVNPGELRWELLKLSIAIVLLSFGGVALAFFLFRSKARERTLIYFGLFAILYGVRLLSTLKTVSLSLPFSQAFWFQFNWMITAVIVLPFELFLYQLADGAMKRFLYWLIAIQAVFSSGGILGALFGVNLAKLYAVNNYVVLGTLATTPFAYALTRRPHGPRASSTREIRVFLAGFVVWLLFILYANLLGLGVLRGRDVEYLGFLVFVCCLGYVTAHRSFAREELLVSLHKEMDIARQIQASTLPREVPRLSGLDIAARYVPMSAVAGDFYDFLVLDEHRVGLLVADVTGHGVPAALIASMLKVAFAGQLENVQDPAHVLAGLNRALCGKFEDHFVTAIYVFLDLGKGVMRCAGAGHPPLLLVSSANGGARRVEENGLMLGLFPDASYTSAEIPLRPGDRCLLYTDGLF